ncbi:ATP-binding protein [Chitinimonas sp. PSY-7]|uniref:ATP-binding protein n=1 Tax=Chitinimonas sp. PSY-7 TaxID=3459088 RepID=UPI0040403517
MSLIDYSQLSITSIANLQDSGEITDALLKAAYSDHLGVFVWDLSNQTVIWNETMYEIYGWASDAGNETAAGWLAMLHPEDVSRVDQEIDAALCGDQQFDTTFRVRDPDGGWRHIKAMAWIDRLDDGTPRRMTGINQDITHTARLNALVDSIQMGTSDRVSRPYFESLVVNLGSALGVRYAMVAEVYPREQPTHARAIALSVEGELGEPLVYELWGTPCANVLSDDFCIYPADVQQHFPKDKLLVDMKAECYVGVALRAADGTVLGLLEVLDDKIATNVSQIRSVLELFAGRAGAELERLQREVEVTQLNTSLESQVATRTDELHRTMRELEAFTYSVSHDLNAPLRAIHGFCSIVREDYLSVLDQTGLDYLDRSLNAAERMGRLLDDLVSLSKISLRPLAVGKVNLTDMAHEIVADLQERQPYEGLQFDVVSPLLIHADPGLMRILLDCLLRNAWQFIENVAAPHIQVMERQREGRREIVVQDNGRGFEPEAIDRLFAPFQTLNSQGGFTGSGTGLAIAQRIVLRHHGSIMAESQPGQGASFSFWLPPAGDLMALLADDPL